MDTDEKQPRKSDPSRRRLLIGLAGTPILASLPSRSAWGQECSISGMISGNISNHLHECPVGEGMTAYYWAIRPLCWPDPFVPTLALGTMRTTNGGGSDSVVEPCNSSVKYDDTGAFKLPEKYYFDDDGTSLDDLIDGILTAYTSSSWPMGRFSSSLMTYIRGSDGIAKSASCAILNALHTGVSYPYSALEICQAWLTVYGDWEREAQLKGVFDYFDILDVSTGSLIVRSC